MKSRLWGAVSALVFSSITLSSHAALVGVLPATPGGSDWQAYYDDIADLTWLANANTNGEMDWAAVNVWVAGLDIDGIVGWRLPDTPQPDSTCSIGDAYGYNCTGSELGNLFYNVLGGTAGVSITTTHNSNYDLFSNVQSNIYWSSTELAPSLTHVWDFDFGIGRQATGNKISTLYAWAVQPGNVGAVPVPAAVWLFGSGLIGLVSIARNKSASCMALRFKNAKTHSK